MGATVYNERTMRELI